MKLWEPGKPGSFNVLSLADNEASVSKQQDQGQRESEEESRPENLQDTAYKQVAEY